MPTYTVVGYNWNESWMHREISRVTGSPINHVSIRVTGADSVSHEVYITTENSHGTWLPTKLVERAHSPAIFVGKSILLRDFKELNIIKQAARDWTNANHKILPYRGYFHHYLGRRLGMQAPPCCSRLCSEVLNQLNIPVTEQFYPHLLVEDYIRETYRCM